MITDDYVNRSRVMRRLRGGLLCEYIYLYVEQLQRVGYAHRVFTAVLRKVGLRDPQLHSPGPRIHDLRHRFAVNTILRWYRAGEDVERLLPTLYLHAHLALKEAALAKVKPFNGQKGGRYKPSDRLLAFLDAL
jgi:hypothetical protein